jgi:RNA polymerase sigma factor (sigma-70 family)
MCESKDKELVQAYLQGTSGAERRLVDTLSPIIRMVALRYVGAWSRNSGVHDRAASLADLVQQVWIRLLERGCIALRRFDPERGSLRTFISRVARNVCHSYTQRATMLQSSTERSDEDPGDLVDPGPGLEQQIEAAELTQAVYSRLMQQLSPEDQAVFIHRFVEQRDYDEIVELTGLRKDLLFVRVHRIKRRAVKIREELVPTPPRKERA